MTDKKELEAIIAQVLSMDIDQVAELAAALDEVRSCNYGKVEILVKDQEVYQINRMKNGKPKWKK